MSTEVRSDVGHRVDADLRDALYIGGQWVAPSAALAIDVIDPTTEERLGRVPAGTADDAASAVAAAVDAFRQWSAVPPLERADFLDRLADAIADREDDLSLAIAREVGSPLAFSRTAQVQLPVAVTRGMAAAVRAFAWEEPIGNTLVVREPVGVAVAITPWNYPLHQALAKVAAALGAGCSVILKPSGQAPLSAFALADLIDSLGLPAGTFNLISGAGATTGEALIADERVDLVSLTGSNGAGRRVMELAAPTAKRVTLELGGKSATVVLDDADLDAVIPASVLQSLRNSGQNCSALSRLIVPRSRLAEVERLAVDAAAAVTVGDPLDPSVQMGPLVSAAQRERVRDYIRAGRADGATLLTGGEDPRSDLARGWFLPPTVFGNVTPRMRIAREEIFGPVLAILPYDGGDDEAIAIANNSAFGLSGAVWSTEPLRAERVARRMRTGRVAINGGPLNAEAPFGGYKASGVGREFGRYGLEEYLEVKTLQR